MNKYSDMVESTFKIIEAGEKDQFLATLEFSWGEGDFKNKNDRTYPFEKVWKPAVETFENKVKASVVPGQSDHPMLSSNTQLASVSHILQKIWLEGKKAFARASILKTSKGVDLLRVLKSGVTLGASLRGMGEVDAQGNVKPGLTIQTVDLVLNPSFKDAKIGINNIVQESVILGEGCGHLSFDEKRMAGVHSGRQMLKENKRGKRTKEEGKLFTEAVVAGYMGTFEEWKERDA